MGLMAWSRWGWRGLCRRPDEVSYQWAAAESVTEDRFTKTKLCYEASALEEGIVGCA
jgi:hypothetical protein